MRGGSGANHIQAGAAGMNIQMMHEVTRISDRFIGRESLNSIDKQGRLISVVAMVFVFHIVTGVALFKMDEFSEKRTRFIPNLDIAFEADVLLKALPTPPVTPVPPAMALTKGLINSPGGMIADKLAAEKLTIPIPVAAQQTDVVVAARPAAAEQNRKSDVRPDTASEESTSESTAVATRTQNEGKQLGVNVARNESGAPANSGNSEGSDFGKEDGKAGHAGVGGVGSVSGIEGQGGEEGLAGGNLPTALATLPVIPTTQKRDIAPYRDNLVALLANNWKVRGRVKGLTVYILIGSGGEVVESRIVRSSGKDSVDRSVLEAVRNTQFEPLPEWYKGDSLPFQIEMQKR